MLRVAADLAERHQAHLIGLYVTLPAHTYLYSEMPIPAVVEDYHSSYHTALSEKLSALFLETTAERGLLAEWRHAETPALPVTAIVSELAHTADLLVVGQCAASGAQYPDLESQCEDADADGHSDAIQHQQWQIKCAAQLNRFGLCAHFVSILAGHNDADAS